MIGRVAIVGCGLIGGSLVKALRERKAAGAISAVDREAVLADAGPFLDDAAAPESEHASRLVCEADIVVLAMPVGAIVSQLRHILDLVRADGVVTDTGSVKHAMLARAASHPRAARYLPGHPMAGREIGGFGASSATLFEGTRWYVVPDAAAPGVEERTVDLITAVGATPVVISAEEHDRAMAYVSHTPQLVASALIALAKRAGALGDAGPGFRDTTRIAGGPTAVWRDILWENRAPVARSLRELVEILANAASQLSQTGASADSPSIDPLIALLEEAALARDPKGTTAS